MSKAEKSLPQAQAVRPNPWTGFTVTAWADSGCTTVIRATCNATGAHLLKRRGPGWYVERAGTRTPVATVQEARRVASLHPRDAQELSLGTLLAIVACVLVPVLA